MNEKICRTIDYVVDCTPLLIIAGALTTSIAIVMGVYGLIVFIPILIIMPMYFRWTLIEGEVPEIRSENDNEEETDIHAPSKKHLQQMPYRNHA